MAAHAHSVLSDLLTALRADLGDYDLSTTSSTPRVVIADGGRPPVSPPYLLLSAPTVSTTYQPAALGEYWVRGRIEWFGYVAATAETTEARAFAALDFADEIITAIQDAHASSSYTTLHSLVELLVSVTDVFADGPDLAPAEALVHGEITYAVPLTRGV
jgi:hypothetical protein